MIISHRHRFIFFAVPRTATHSLRQALRPHLDAGDWEQQMLSGHQVLPVTGLAEVGHGHVSVGQARRALPEEMWRSYYKFAFVRNPFDRFVSVCAFLNRGNPGFAGRETVVMKSLLARPRFRRRVLVRPQSQLLDGGTGALDFIGRFESLQEDFDTVCSAVDLPAGALPAVNDSRHRAWTDCYDAELAAAVAHFYRADFSAYAYPDAVHATEHSCS